MEIASLLLVMAVCSRFHPLILFHKASDVEYFSWAVAKAPTVSEIAAMTANDVHPPLYYVLLHGWMGIFGQSMFAMRLLSALLGTLTVVSTWWFARCWLGRDGHSNPDRIGLLAAALVAVAPPMIGSAATARMYPLLALLALVSSASLLEALQRPLLRWWCAYVFAAALMAYTHNYGVVLIACHALFMAIHLLRERDPVHRSRVAWGGLIAIGAALGMWLPWLFVLLKQTAMVVAADYWIDPLKWEFFGALAWQWVQWPLWTLRDIDPRWYETLILGGLTLWVLWPWRGKPGEHLILCCILVYAAMFLAMALIFDISVAVPRFLIHMIPLTAAPVAYLLCTIRAAPARLAAVSSLIAALTLTTCFLGYREAARADPWRDLAVRIAHEGTDRDVIAALDPYRFLLMQYHLERHGRWAMPVLYVPKGGADDPGRHAILMSAVPASQRVSGLDDIRFVGKRVWVLATPFMPSQPGWRLLESVKLPGADPIYERVLLYDTAPQERASPSSNRP